MKTVNIIAIAAAVLALAACTKEQGYNESSFKEGQIVTINVTADASVTKVTSELNGTAVDFKWEAGDKILVTVDSKTAEFTLDSGAGESSATFTGTMPADGSTFDVQYPVEDTTLTTQTYSSSEAIPHNMMKFAQTGCMTSSPTFSLTPQNAALKLNLWGVSQTISKIVVTNTTSSATYTLNISGGKELSTDSANPTPFFIVVPAGDWNFSAEIFDNAATPASICTFTSSAAQTFAVNQILNMAAKKVEKAGNFYPGTELEGIEIDGVVWSPVNCGYDATSYPYGKLYQWGRKDGCGYNDGNTYKETLIQTSSSTTAPIASTAENASVFYISENSPYDWLTPKNDTRWNSGSESSPVKTSNDPCPTGWRVPTYTELNALTGNNGSTSIGSGGWDDTKKGYWFNGSASPESGEGLFLPAAGYRFYFDGNAYSRGGSGSYWSSSVSDNGARGLMFYDSDAFISVYSRANGRSVRCVQE